MFKSPVKRNFEERGECPMAGHSKWHNIQRRKNAQDAKRGKIFMRHAKLVYTAAKQGGGDPETNPALRLAIDKAKADNMPNDNIDRAIKKATGTLDGASYEELTYEGYGPGGTAIIVHVLTDNKNRTAAEVRHAFNKNGGNLGENGCVAFMFDRQGYIVVPDEEGNIDEYDITMKAIEDISEDIITKDRAYEIITSPESIEANSTNLRDDGYTLTDEKITLITQNYSSLPEEEEKKMLNLIVMLEED